MHAVVDGLGNPLYFQLSAGSVHDSKVATEVLSHVPLEQNSVVADKAYGTNEIRSFLTSHQAAYAIPPKSNTVDPWACDWWTYKERHSVECFFNKLKHFCRVATRYDKLAASF
ncbi:transposase [Domibacillus indicus]|uniref:transposase n=1 Tax=Domibacillus indicus TaxID=1437523 RepID=UPI0038B3EAC3